MAFFGRCICVVLITLIRWHIPRHYAELSRERDKERIKRKGVRKKERERAKNEAKWGMGKRKEGFINKESDGKIEEREGERKKMGKTYTLKELNICALYVTLMVDRGLMGF